MYSFDLHLLSLVHKHSLLLYFMMLCLNYVFVSETTKLSFINVDQSLSLVNKKEEANEVQQQQTCLRIEETYKKQQNGILKTNSESFFFFTSIIT